MSARLRFMGAAREVTGSSHLLTTPAAKILLDCGLFQGRRSEFYERNTHFGFDPSDIDACILSHAHIDHSGNLPNLVKQGFRSRILATDATRDLCAAMLPDSGHIQEEDAKFVSKIHSRKGAPPVRPLYTREEPEETLQYFSGHPYRQKIRVAGGAAVVFYDAGHVLGSATPLVELETGGEPLRIAYAVDLGRADIPILKDPERPPEIDYLILESTYGGRRHDPLETTNERLASIIGETVARGGKIVIPSFALERTQALAFNLNRLLREKRIPDIPVFVDSPLAVNITEVFIRHPECYDEEMYEEFRSGRDPLGTARFEYITDVERSKQLNDDKRPMIIISASGMCEAGRILHHLKNTIGNPRNTVLIVGFMARETLGRRILERHETVKIFGEPHPLRACVEVLNSLSAHADSADLLDYVKPLRGSVKRIFLVHGEEDQAQKLAALLREHGLPVHLPERGEEVELAG